MNMRLFLAATCAAAAAVGSAGSLASTQSYDVVIAGGRVIDPETDLDAIRNVGIPGDRITAISEETRDGERVIDARGLIVSPGFIDRHAHGQNLGDYRMQGRLLLGAAPDQPIRRSAAEETTPGTQ